MSNEILTVLIIGCGNIGGGFDLDYQGDMPPCTHAGAFAQDKRFRIIACVDPDLEKCRRFQSRWQIESIFPTLDEAINAGLDVDVVSICSPTANHTADIIAAAKLSPRLIFCEKPITPTVSESREVLSLCERHNILLVVNYNRRWDVEITNLKQAIATGRYGELRSVVGFYNKGLLNNGSHLLDLLDYLLGHLTVVSTLPAFVDYFDKDPSVTALLTSDYAIPIHLVTGHANDYALFECQFIFASGVLSMEEGGMHWLHRKTKASARFKDYIVLDNGSYAGGGLANTLTNAVSNIYEAIVSGTELASDGESALRAQILCADLLKEASE